MLGDNTHVHEIETRDGEALLEVGSGTCVFTAKAPAPRVAVPQASKTTKEEFDEVQDNKNRRPVGNHTAGVRSGFGDDADGDSLTNESFSNLASQRFANGGTSAGQYAPIFSARIAYALGDPAQFTARSALIAPADFSCIQTRLLNSIRRRPRPDGPHPRSASEGTER